MVSFQHSRLVNTVSVFGLEQQIWAAALWLLWTDELICLFYCGSMHELTLQTCQQLWMIQKCNHLSWLYSQSALLCLQLNQWQGKTLVTPDVLNTAVVTTLCLVTRSTPRAGTVLLKTNVFQAWILKEAIEALHMIWTWASAMFWGSESWGHSQVCDTIIQAENNCTQIFTHFSDSYHAFPLSVSTSIQTFPPT